MDRGRELPSDEEVLEKAETIKGLLQEALSQDPQSAAQKIDTARSLKRELEKMGFLVQWKATLNPQTLVCAVTVKVFKPKKNMTPEEGRLYDEWLLKHAKAETL